MAYATEKVVHYGGSFEAPLLSKHPVSGQTILRFAEPVDDLNAVRVEMLGHEQREQIAFFADMRERLRDRKWCYAHRWVAGDVVIADNHALLHGRRAFTHPTMRHLRRVHVL